jgi:hypothetical protein
MSLTNWPFRTSKAYTKANDYFTVGSLYYLDEDLRFQLALTLAFRLIHLRTSKAYTKTNGCSWSEVYTTLMKISDSDLHLLGFPMNTLLLNG